MKVKVDNVTRITVTTDTKIGQTVSKNAVRVGDTVIEFNSTEDVDRVIKALNKVRETTTMDEVYQAFVMDRNI